MQSGGAVARTKVRAEDKDKGGRSSNTIMKPYFTA